MNIKKELHVSGARSITHHLRTVSCVHHCQSGLRPSPFTPWQPPPPPRSHHGAVCVHAPFSCLFVFSFALSLHPCLPSLPLHPAACSLSTVFLNLGLSYSNTDYLFWRCFTTVLWICSYILLLSMNWQLLVNLHLPEKVKSNFKSHVAQLFPKLRCPLKHSCLLISWALQQPSHLTSAQVLTWMFCLSLYPALPQYQFYCLKWDKSNSLSRGGHLNIYSGRHHCPMSPSGRGCQGVRAPQRLALRRFALPACPFFSPPSLVSTPPGSPASAVPCPTAGQDAGCRLRTWSGRRPPSQPWSSFTWGVSASFLNSFWTPCSLKPVNTLLARKTEQPRHLAGTVQPDAQPRAPTAICGPTGGGHDKSHCIKSAPGQAVRAGVWGGGVRPMGKTKLEGGLLIQAK